MASRSGATRASPASSAHDSKVAARVVQPPAAVGGRGDDVLDPYPEPPRQVDPGLDREAHAGLDRTGLALDHVRRLVDREADAVAGAVDEPLAVPGAGDHAAGGAVDVLAGGAGADRVERGLLGEADDVVHLRLLLGWLADVDGAGRVRPVAVLRAAEVQDDHVALLDDAVALLVVGVRAVRAGGDDGELGPLVSVCDEEACELGGDLGLGPAGEAARRDLLEDGVRRGPGGGHPLEL